MRRLTLMLILLAACAAGLPPLAASELVTAPAEQRALPLVRWFDGTVEAVNQATVKAETAGTVEELPFDVDDFVPAGAVLVRFRDTEPRARAASARAALAEAQAQLVAAEQEYQRTLEVFERKLIAKRNLDAALAARDSAKARVDAARARLAETEAQLEHTVVRAPYAGIVTARHVEVGESAQPGQPLLSGLSLEQLRVTGQVPQSVVPALREAPRVEVVAAGLPPVPAGRVLLFPYADPATHTVGVRVELPNGGSAGLYPGMHVKLAVTLGEEPRLVVPEAALVRRSELAAVYVVDDRGRVDLRQVRPGRADAGWQVIHAGLAAGERVAVDPVAAGVALKSQAGG
ncbi:MAG TPA: efflux RND transporter periplasmic adaptor subunit [Gammaproteobacteria bacterium]